MLTRSGGVERHHIGGIRIHDRTSHVEIAIEAAERFQKRTANPTPDQVQVRPIDQPGTKPRRDFGTKPPRNEPSKPPLREERSKPKPDQARKPRPKHKGKG
jgi:ATP-dependent RNA helicase DeaD